MPSVVVKNVDASRFLEKCELFYETIGHGRFLEIMGNYIVYHTRDIVHDYQGRDGSSVKFWTDASLNKAWSGGSPNQPWHDIRDKYGLKQPIMGQLKENLKWEWLSPINNSIGIGIFHLPTLDANVPYWETQENGGEFQWGKMKPRKIEPKNFIKAGLAMGANQFEILFYEYIDALVRGINVMVGKELFYTLPGQWHTDFGSTRGGAPVL